MQKITYILVILSVFSGTGCASRKFITIRSGMDLQISANNTNNYIRVNIDGEGFTNLTCKWPNGNVLDVMCNKIGYVSVSSLQNIGTERFVYVSQYNSNGFIINRNFVTFKHDGSQLQLRDNDGDGLVDLRVNKNAANGTDIQETANTTFVLNSSTDSESLEAP